MPVSGFNSVVIGHSTVTAPPATTAPSPPSSMTSTSPSNSSTPSPINSLPHKNAQQQQNGNHLLPDDMDVCNGLEKPSPAGSRQLLTDESDFNLMDDFSNHLSISPKPPQAQSSFDREKSEMRSCLSMFNDWSTGRQSDFVEQLIVHMSFHQHERLYSILIPMLQRDFITALPGKGLHHVAYKILSYLDAQSLCRAELVCSDWYRVVADGMLWKKLIERKVKTDPVWKGLSIRRGWRCYLNAQNSPPTDVSVHDYFRKLYPCIIQDIRNMEENWRNGRQNLTRIECHSENSKGVYCLQYDDKNIVSGLRDNTIKVWRKDTLECVKVLTGHTGSVLCLQYDEKVIVTGSSDSTIRVWDVESGIMLNTLVHHCEAVLHLRFNNETMVTCSKDRTIAVWDMRTPSDIVLRRVLVGHRAAVNVVDFDDRYIVSASGDRTIKVWQTSNCEFVRTLHGHRRGIACLQYRGNHVVSGSSDNTIRIWDVECGSCLRLLEGHEELVRCIRFDDKRIVSGAYDGTIKVWDLKAALDPRTPASSLCLKTLSEHTGRVFRLQFDDFQIVSSSHDDTILIWDFLDSSPPDPMETDEEEAREGGEASGRDPPQQVLHRHSSEEPDSPTADDVNFSLPNEDNDGSPSFNDADHLSLSDH